MNQSINPNHSLYSTKPNHTPATAIADGSRMGRGREVESLKLNTLPPQSQMAHERAKVRAKTLHLASAIADGSRKGRDESRENNKTNTYLNSNKKTRTKDGKTLVGLSVVACCRVETVWPRQ